MSASMEIISAAVKHIDATPDDGYPLRILRAYRASCDMRFHANPPLALVDKLNDLQERRAEILDTAIALLEAALKP